MDDDHLVGKLTGELIASFGMEVQVVAGGAEALEVMPKFQPRIVFVDIGMPGIDGYETAAGSDSFPAEIRYSSRRCRVGASPRTLSEAPRLDLTGILLNRSKSQNWKICSPRSYQPEQMRRGVVIHIG